ncbi:MAG: hypothetical protein Q7U97_12155 [Rhodocyclaceae bacterium]|nr:hypothetical protein [Rhodocyclaceae bacterium]
MDDSDDLAGGFLDFLKRKDYSTSAKKVLASLGSQPVRRITLSRAPINGLISKAFNAVSFGKFAQLQKQYGHDRLFHLSMIVEVGSRRVVVEKNATVNVSTSIKNEPDAEFFDVPLQGPLTLSSMLSKAQAAMRDDFWLYNFATNNCQVFIREILKASGLLTGAADRWLFQDVGGLEKDLGPVASNIAHGVTDLGAVVNRIIGAGKPTPLEILVWEHMMGV